MLWQFNRLFILFCLVFNVKLNLILFVVFVYSKKEKKNYADFVSTEMYSGKKEKICVCCLREITLIILHVFLSSLCFVFCYSNNSFFLIRFSNDNLIMACKKFHFCFDSFYYSFFFFNKNLN